VVHIADFALFHSGHVDWIRADKNREKSVNFPRNTTSERTRTSYREIRPNIYLVPAQVLINKIKTSPCPRTTHSAQSCRRLSLCTRTRDPSIGSVGQQNGAFQPTLRAPRLPRAGAKTERKSRRNVHETCHRRAENSRASRRARSSVPNFFYSETFSKWYA